MKKILFFLIIFLFPFGVNAIDSNYLDLGTNKYYIEANILKNGDMEIKELKILFGSFNGHESIINYSNPKLTKFTGRLNDFSGSDIYNASGIENVRIYGVKYDNNKEFDLINSQNRTEFKMVNSAELGEYGVYTKEGNTYRIYLPSERYEASLVTYTLKDVVVIHNDVAEVAWDFISSQYKEEIADLRIVINLPDDSQELRVFSHGPLYGENKINSRSQVTATWQNIDAYKAVDVRVVFDKDLVSLGNKKSNFAGLTNILAVEEIRAKQANDIRDGKVCQLNCDFDSDGICDLNCDKNNDQTCDLNCDTNADYICDLNCDTNKDGKCDYKCFIDQAVIAAYVSIATLIVIGVYYYLKHDREYRSDFKSKYYREFIEDYNVEQIDYIMKRKISPDAMSASILNLIYKKNISVDKTIDKNNKPTYLFTKLNDSQDKAEKALMDFLFDDVGDGKTFTDEGLKSYAKSTSTYNTFLSSYSIWKRIVTTSAKANAFWVSNNMKITFVIIIMILFFIYTLLMERAQWLGNVGLMAIAFLLYFVVFIYIVSAQKRTKKGNEHYLKWRAFKNFLNDFGAFEKKDLPEIILWERYIVYATVFGLADKVSKTMNVKIQEFDQPTNFHPSYLDYIIFNNMINRTITDSFAAAKTTAAAVRVANSTRSSGSGFGGGSSFGGGGFGGGGSGGGRF